MSFYSPSNYVGGSFLTGLGLDRGNINIQPCEKLKNIDLQHYNEFCAREKAQSIEYTYSRQEGVVLISNDPYEWFDDRDSIEAFKKGR